MRPRVGHARLERLDAGVDLVCVSKVPRTASSVFSPSPVITITTRSSGSMSPRAASLASTAIVTPPAVSVKTPVVCASRRDAGADLLVADRVDRAAGAARESSA